MRSNKAIVLMLIMSLLFSLEAEAKRVSTDCLLFEVPDSLKNQDMEGLPFFAYNEDYVIGVAEYKGDFDPSKVKASMDSIFFDLSKARLIDTDSEYFFQWTKDYSKKYYEREDGKYIITYSSYGTDVAYCFYFVYKEKTTRKKINKIISSIQEKKQIEDCFIENAWNAGKYASVSWILYYLLIIIIGLLLSFATSTWLEKIISALGVTLFAAIILLFTCWGRWDIFLGALVLTFVVNLVFNISARVVIFIFKYFDFD